MPGVEGTAQVADLLPHWPWLVWPQCPGRASRPSRDWLTVGWAELPGSGLELIFLGGWRDSPTAREVRVQSQPLGPVLGTHPPSLGQEPLEQLAPSHNHPNRRSLPPFNSWGNSSGEGQGAFPRSH